MPLLKHLPLGAVGCVESQAVGLVVAALQQLDHRSPALCELRLDEADFSWLNGWARHLRPDCLELTGWHAGGLLLLLGTEAARREAQEGEFWPVLAAREYQPATRARLFGAGDSPSAFCRELMEEAARRLGILHAFDLDDTQRWYVTAYLQFGFTLAGAKQSLAEWLGGQHVTRAIEILLDPRRGSRSFQRLWDTLRFYRRDYLTESQARQRLRESSWVLPTRVGDLLRSACPGGGPPPPPDEPDPVLVEAPRLAWEPPDEPHFVCRPADTAPLRLTASRYQYRLGKQVLATLFRQPGGSYRTDRDELSLPCDRPELSLTLTGADGQVHASQVLELWDAGEEVHVFSAGGSAVGSGEPLDAERAYVLQLAPGLHLTPEPSTWQRVGGSHRRLWALLEGWSKGLCVCDSDGTSVWTPTPLQRPPAPLWAQRIQVEWTAPGRHVPLGSDVRFRLAGLGPGVEVTYLRLNGKPLEFDARQGTLAPVPVKPEVALAGWRFRIGLRREGEAVRIERKPNVPVLGAAVAAADGSWKGLNPDNPLTAREARVTPCRLVLPADLPEARPALLEGSIFLRRVGGSARPLGVLPGTGAPLLLRDGPYNTIGDLLRLASAVIDYGLVRRLEFDRGASRYHLELVHGVEPGPEHSVVCWAPEAGLRRIPQAEIRAGEGGWRWEVASPWPEPPRNVVCAVGYAGYCQGFGRLGRWEYFLLPPPAGAPAEAVRQAAALVRWCRLPGLLSDRAGRPPFFQRFARERPAEVLSVWLFDSGLGGTELLFDEDAEAREVGWSILRQIYAGWELERGAAAAVLGLFAQLRPADPHDALVEWLLPEDPLLTAHVLRQTWLFTLAHEQRAAARGRLRRWRCRVAGREDDTSDNELRQYAVDRLESAARTMRQDARFNLDPNFIVGIVDPALTWLIRRRRLTPVEAANLAVASGVGAFREYLGLRVLAELEQVVVY